MTPERRSLLGLLGAALLAGCDRLVGSKRVNAAIARAEDLNLAVHRFFLRPTSLAREYDEADLSPVFRSNGTRSPQDPGYKALAAGGFSDWRLVVDGLVERPLSLSLDQIRAMPARTQITRHDCVEGWSCIGKWTGVQLARVLQRAGLKQNARYIVFHCADTMETARDGSPVRYYESVDLEDAFHPQTILAWAMNGRALPVPHGAPLRLRVERQLGYKHAKYLMRIEAVERLDAIEGGKGGYWEDRGYEWYAGI